MGQKKILTLTVMFWFIYLAIMVCSAVFVLKRTRGHFQQPLVLILLWYVAVIIWLGIVFIWLSGINNNIAAMMLMMALVASVTFSTAVGAVIGAVWANVTRTKRSVSPPPLQREPGRVTFDRKH